MLAVFGIPGGAEWAIIVGIIVLLFVPGAGFLGLGYLLGRNKAEKDAAAGTPGKSGTPEETQGKLAAPPNPEGSKEPVSDQAPGQTDETP